MPDEYQGENLIFIISQPRSGSTLLQRVLSGHPEVLSSAETWLMLNPLYGLRRSGIQTEYEAEWAVTAVKEFLSNYTDGPAIYDKGLRAFAQAIYGNALNRANKRYFLDKTPRYYYVSKELYRVFPKARFIFLLRNPMAVLSSELNTYVKNNPRFLSSFHDDLLLAPDLIMDAIDYLGTNANVLRYESFVKEPEQEISRLCEQMGFRFYPEMLNYSATPAPVGVMNDPVGIHRHASPSTDSFDRWKDMADDPQKRHYAESYLEALGPNTVSRMGYSYDEISETLSGSEIKSRRANLFPWDIAIKPAHQWSMKQRMLIRHRAAVTKRGPLLGFVVGLFSNVYFLGRHILNAIGTNSSKA